MPGRDVKFTPPKIPSLRHHKASGQAVVTVSGRDIYLGKWRSKASEVEYHRLIKEWVANDYRLPVQETDLTVAELVRDYRRYARGYYRKNGQVTSEVQGIDLAVKPLIRIYSSLPAREFSPRKLKAVRQLMIETGWCRNVINQHVGRIKRMFQWAVEVEILPEGVLNGLRALKGLRRGHEGVRESEPVLPVPEEHIEAVLPLVPGRIAAVIQLQRLTGARPGEILAMRTQDIDRGGKVWIFIPEAHKTEHHGHKRAIHIGPKAQEVLQPFLKLDQSAYLFSPEESERERQDERSGRRKTPRFRSHMKNNQKRRKRRPKKKPGDRYSVNSYRQVIQRACDVAKVPRWAPNQLRHNAATYLRKEFGLDVARAVLGHRTPITTEIYAEIDGKLAADVMGKVG